MQLSLGLYVIDLNFKGIQSENNGSPQTKKRGGNKKVIGKIVVCISWCFGGGNLGVG